LSFNFIGVTFP